MTRLNDKTSALSARIADLVLRVFPRNTADVLRWIITTHGEEDTQDVFHGMGFAARPAAGANAEAIAVAVNGYDHHVIVATRDADTLRRVIAKIGLELGEAMVFSSGTVLKCSAGKIRAQSHDGTPSPLALKSDVQAIWDYLAKQFDPTTGHKHAGVTTGAGSSLGPVPSTTSSSVPVGAPTGTTFFEAE